MRLTAELPTGRVSRHELVMRYELPLPTDAVDRALNPYDGSYHDYVRFYLPLGAALDRFEYTEDGRPSTRGSLESVFPDRDKQVVAAFFILPRGHVGELRLNYQVALDGRRRDSIYIQKQAGIPGFPVNLMVSYPGGEASRRLFTDRDREEIFSW
jgi:hypothetical protein